MKRTMLVLAVVLVIVLSVASPAIALTGADGAGRDYGQHHAQHAREFGGFTGTENPGRMHRGFSGWQP